MSVRTSMKCEHCGQVNWFKAERDSDEEPYLPLRIETCKKCNKIFAEPKMVTRNRHSKSSVSNEYPNMMRSEKQVAEFLSELNLPWIFELPVFVYDNRKRPRVWTPDFFIPKLGIYIEVCGSKTFNYDYREKICRNNGVNVIFLHFYKKESYWRKFLFKRIKEVEDQRHSDATKLIENVPAELPDKL